MALIAASGKLTSAATSKATQRRTLASRNLMPTRQAAMPSALAPTAIVPVTTSTTKKRPPRLDTHVPQVALGIRQGPPGQASHVHAVIMPGTFHDLLPGHVAE